MAKLNAKALGLSLGIIWAVAAFIMGILAMTFGYGGIFVKALGSLYIGYEATLKGSIIGAIWGFIDAGICGIIIAWLYNKLAK
ncbi:MAG: bacteriophage holin [Candidatus Kaelpia imicola]|nr:bacteriophage holin [Candidatus Kaelpia imicola]